MPELPEVEVFVRNLQSAVGQRIQRTEVLDARLRLDGCALEGKAIEAIERRGKHILIQLSDDSVLVVHLRMSGRLRLHRGKEEAKYTRLTLHLGNGESIYFVNPRRLGTALHCTDGFQSVLGLEPLAGEFTSDALASLTRKSRSPIKLFLLDQRKIAGVGNIYASESLWRSGIAPQRPANGLSDDEVARLHQSIVSVLNDAIADQGTSIGNGVSDYRPSVGEQGEFQNHLSVYGREAEPCEQCGSAILRLKQGGRSTYYCRTCQN
jgi:formamidopyrimidine-DNA glycosylase